MIYWYLRYTYKSLSNKKKTEINCFIEIPSEIFSQLKLQKWKLSWRPPEDCTTISGPLKSKINIRGISDAVKNFNITKQTVSFYYNLNKLNPKLNGVERYVATVYVIRDYDSKVNLSAYQKYEFETPPTGEYLISKMYNT